MPVLCEQICQYNVGNGQDWAILRVVFKACLSYTYFKMELRHSSMISKSMNEVINVFDLACLKERKFVIVKRKDTIFYLSEKEKLTYISTNS